MKQIIHCYEYHEADYQGQPDFVTDELAANVTPTRQPGDIDCAQLAVKIKRSTNTARKRMDEEE